MRLHDLPTPAVVIDADHLQHNLTTMAAVHPGPALRPHVKAHKCTELAAMQHAQGHHSFTCATPRDVVGMAEAGWGDDLLLANEVLDPGRLSPWRSATRASPSQSIRPTRSTPRRRPACAKCWST